MIFGLHNKYFNLKTSYIIIIYRGQFAIVRKCMEIKTGEFYAAKIMRKRRVARGVAAADIGMNIRIHL